VSSESQRNENFQLRLHNAARRYCIERHAHWWEVYAKQRGAASSGNYSEDDLKTFPRYNVLDAILKEIERIDPRRLTSLSEARGLLTLAGQTAETIFTKPPYLPLVEATMEEERLLFAEFIRNVSESEMEKTAQVFFRRVLTAHESSFVRAELKRRWNVTGGYWYPLSDHRPLETEAFDAVAFDQDFPIEELRCELAGRGVNRVFELQEIGGVDYEMEAGVFEPVYGMGGEAFWCSNEFDWLIYASHETSITVAGGWLLDCVKVLWPEWSKAVWNLDCDLPRKDNAR
jgi:hypothetical protein